MFDIMLHMMNVIHDDGLEVIVWCWFVLTWWLSGSWNVKPGIQRIVVLVFKIPMIKYDRSKVREEMYYQVSIYEHYTIL